MEEVELPDWVVKLRKSYQADPVRWMWGTMTVLVVLLIVGMGWFLVGKQKAEAGGLLSTGMQQLEAQNYALAMQSFERIRSSYRLSGYGDQALLMSGAALFGLERYADAEQAYRQFLAEEPGDELAPQAELGIGACREMQEDAAGALAIYRAARDKYPESFLAKAFDIRIARLSLAAGDTAAAAAIYDRLERDTEGLWLEIARGNRRMPSSVRAVPEPAATPAADGGR